MNVIHPGTTSHGYRFGEMLNSGGYGEVYRVWCQKYNMEFVAKASLVSEENADAIWHSFDQEVSLLKCLDHPSIIKLYDHFRLGNRFVMVLEYCSQGSVWDYMMRNGALRGRMLLRVIRDVSSALVHAWSRGIAHRDVKPQNLLFTADMRVKLADFGISVIRPKAQCGCANEVDDYRCSLMFAAPEIHEHLPYDPMLADIWSLGATIVTMATGSTPWRGVTQRQIEMSIKFGQYKMPDNCNSHVLKLVEEMLIVYPGHRMTVATMSCQKTWEYFENQCEQEDMSDDRARKRGSYGLHCLSCVSRMNKVTRGVKRKKNRQSFSELPTFVEIDYQSSSMLFGQSCGED